MTVLVAVVVWASWCWYSDVRAGSAVRGAGPVTSGRGQQFVVLV